MLSKKYKWIFYLFVSLFESLKKLKFQWKWTRRIVMQGKHKLNTLQRMFLCLMISTGCVVRSHWCRLFKNLFTCVRGVYLFFCACLQMVAQKNTKQLFTYICQSCRPNTPFHFPLSPTTRVTPAYLQLFLLIGISVHKHTQASEVVHISKHRTWEM